jgi:hypothetical protein
MGDTIRAVFKPRIFEDSLVFNEINYNSADDFDPGDWVELYNPHPYPLDVSGWVFKDEDDLHEFVFPEGTTVEADGYLVLAVDPAAFDSLFPDAGLYIGPVGFGLSGNGELIRLYDDEGVIIDTVLFDDQDPWPVEPDGNGPTLELINPAWDNALAESWTASELHGTPGAKNGSFVGQPEPVIPTALSCLIYPNPSTGQSVLRIGSHSGDDVFTLTVISLMGQEVMKIRGITETHTVLNTASLSPGIYVYRLCNQNGDASASGKLVRK